MELTKKRPLEQEIPTADVFKNRRQDEHEKKKALFRESIVKKFLEKTSKEIIEPFVRIPIQYAWQQHIVEDMFQNKNYDIIYRREEEPNQQDTVYADIVLPGVVDLSEPLLI